MEKNVQKDNGEAVNFIMLVIFFVSRAKCVEKHKEFLSRNFFYQTCF